MEQRVSKESNNITTSMDEENQEIQRILKEVPEELLINIIADRLQSDSSNEIKRLIQIASQHSFSGPIPPPQMLSEYNSAHEGLADRIVSID